MPNHIITCPYCFNKFDDSQVHFRMETVFSEDQLDPQNENRTLSDIEIDNNINENDRKFLIDTYILREQFMPNEDVQYENFWRDFGGTTEIASKSKDGQNLSAVLPYHRAVFDPNNDKHKHFFKDIKVDDNNLTVSATDCFGKETTRRVCPVCHNPMPGTYGKNPVKFISIVGITNAGKTVYLSQLSKFFNIYTSKVNITAVPTTTDARNYIKQNIVDMGKPLPMGSPPERLLQPIFFDLIVKKDGELLADTVVIYDIAGENCIDPEKMKKFGKFVEHSDGIMLLIDPSQFDNNDKFTDIAEPVEVLNTIFNVFSNKNNQKICNLPIAICISKGDKIVQDILGKNLDDAQFIQDNNNLFLPFFNSDDYNNLQTQLKQFIQLNDNNLRTHLMNLYDNYNYFLFSAIGTSTEKIEIDGQFFDSPAGPPIPKRIGEPLLWLFHKFGYIKTYGKINPPEKEPEPIGWTCVCGQKGNTEKRCLNCNRKENGKRGWFF